jgi:4-hydroxybenzoate polyprenyltransferase
MTDADRDIARKRIKGRREFAATTVTLVVIEAVLILIWFITGAPRYFWPLWPAIGFAIAIVFTGLNAYGLLNRDVTDGDIDAELNRMKRRS